MSHSGKSAIVTGGASGIGLAITNLLAKQGANVAIFDVNVTAADSAVATLSKDFPNQKFLSLRCNIASWEEQYKAFEKVYATFGSIHFVFANGGITERGRVFDVNECSLEEPNLQTLGVNLNGVIYSVKLAAFYINKNKVSPASEGGNNSKGNIICTASNAAMYPFPMEPVYAASKHGVLGLVRSLAYPFQRHNIQINALAPAVVETNLAPKNDLFYSLILTPMSTVTSAVSTLLADSTLTGVLAELHGDNVTYREHPAFVDADSEKNFDVFRTLVSY